MNVQMARGFRPARRIDAVGVSEIPGIRALAQQRLDPCAEPIAI